MVNRYASIARGESVLPLGLWRITPSHLDTLDRVEGVALGVYARIRIALPEPAGGFAEAWTYLELHHRPGPPEAAYVAHLRRGYRDFGLEPSPLDAALTASGFIG